MANTPGELIKVVASATGVAEATVTTYHRSLREAGLVTKGGRGTSAARPTSQDAARVLIAVGGSRFEKQAADRIVQEFEKVVANYRVASRASGSGEFEAWLENKDGDVEEETGTWSFRFGEMEFDIPFLTELSARHTVADALATIITCAIQEGFTGAIRKAAPHCRPAFGVEVSFHGPRPAASIAINLIGISDEGAFNYTEEMTYHLTDLVDVADGLGQAVEDKLNGEFGDGDLSIQRGFSHRTICAVADLMRAAPESGGSD